MQPISDNYLSGFSTERGEKFSKELYRLITVLHARQVGERISITKQEHHFRRTVKDFDGLIFPKLAVAYFFTQKQRRFRLAQNRQHLFMPLFDKGADVSLDGFGSNLLQEGGFCFFVRIDFHQRFVGKTLGCFYHFLFAVR